MMNRIIQLTEDNSHTIFIPELNITYHSRHGAIQESMHVFIKCGLRFFSDKKKAENDELKIFEVGFGTGLNALLSLNEAIHHQQKIYYETVEPQPLSIEQVQQLNYPQMINPELSAGFLLLHNCSFNERMAIHKNFIFKKYNQPFETFETTNKFHLIYFDAFDYNSQPQLWSAMIFKKLYRCLYDDGLLITYCSKGVVRRTLQDAGFTVKKLKGPPGKREIIQAHKLKN